MKYCSFLRCIKGGFMKIGESEMQKERKYLDDTVTLIRKKSY